MLRTDEQVVGSVLGAAGTLQGAAEALVAAEMPGKFDFISEAGPARS
jgi:hypothetical protein